jgi:hypothetical protein
MELRCQRVIATPLTDLRAARRLETGAAMMASLLGGIAVSPWARVALRYGTIALAIVLFLLSIRRSGERVGRLAERLETREKTNETQRRMLEAAARRPRDRDELVDARGQGG